MTGSATSTPGEVVPEADPPAGGAARSRFTVDGLSFWLFVALVAAALPLLLFHYGAYHWFLRAEWQFLADRGDSRFPDLLKPHGGSHWVAVPRVIYLALWQVFGMTTYRPYQLVVVVMHLAMAVLLRVVMRRAGVRPSLASAAAAVLVLCGPGAVNSIWAFQVSYIGSMTWGLAHLLLADHDGPLRRCDLAGLAFGLLAIMSSAVGITTMVAVGVAVLLRRGWKPALAHTAPLAVIYVGWVLISEGTTRSQGGHPSVGVLLDWVRESVIGTFVGLGRFDVVAWLLVAVLVSGLLVGWGPWQRQDAQATRAQLAAPIGLAVAALFFATTTGIGRYGLLGAVARSDRYVYLEAAFVLPVLAVAAEALAQRWRSLTPALVALFLVPIPFNLGGFDEGVFGPAYMRNQRYILTTAVRMPFARDVPRNVQPAPDPYSSDAVTIGFLLTAEANGKLTPSTIPLSPEVVNEFKVRLGVAQRKVSIEPTGCRTTSGTVDLDPAKGDVLHIARPLSITTQEDGRPTSHPVVFRPGLSGTELTIELPDLHLQVAPAGRATTITLCDGPQG